MNIAFLAHDKKKELMVQFCTAYKSVLLKQTKKGAAAACRRIAKRLQGMAETISI